MPYPSHLSERFAKLPPDLRCVALVGQYLQLWGRLEMQINAAIAGSFDLNNIQSAIMTRNMQLRDKVNVLKTVVGVSPKALKKELTDALNRIVSLSQSERNVIAHDSFEEDDKGDGVRFLVVKAKGKLAMPDTRWSVRDFFEKYDSLQGLSKTIKALPVNLNPPTRNFSGCSDVPKRPIRPTRK